MSQAWIKIETITPDKIEIARIATTLRVDPHTVLGRLVHLWCYWDQHSTTGRIDGIDAAFIDGLLGHAGFSEQIVAVGWMKIDADGVTLPHFDRHNGATAKARALAARRTEKSRGGKRDKSDGRRNAVPLQSAQPEERREEEKREEENPPLPPEGVEERGTLSFSPDAPPTVEIPVALDTPAFHRSWSAWLGFALAKHPGEVGAVDVAQHLALMLSKGHQDEICSRHLHALHCAHLRTFSRFGG